MEQGEDQPLRRPVAEEHDQRREDPDARLLLEQLPALTDRSESHERHRARALKPRIELFVTNSHVSLPAHSWFASDPQVVRLVRAVIFGFPPRRGQDTIASRPDAQDGPDDPEETRWTDPTASPLT